MAEADQTTIKTILLSAPPGQFDIILDDIRILLPKASASSLLDANFVSSVRLEWETASGSASLLANNNKSEDDNGDDDDDACVKAVSTAMDNYLALKFASPGVRAAHNTITSSSSGGGNEKIIIISTYAERIDLHNHHTGSWKGKYTICPSTGSFQGNISIVAHTFENGGNVQVHSNITTCEELTIGSITCSPTDDETQLSAWAKKVTRQIESLEDNEVMYKLEDMFRNMSNNYLKCLRRVMPITRTKMEWNVASHRMVKTLGEGHEKNQFKH